MPPGVCVGLQPGRRGSQPTTHRVAAPPLARTHLLLPRRLRRLQPHDVLLVPPHEPFGLLRTLLLPRLLPTRLAQLHLRRLQLEGQPQSRLLCRLRLPPLRGHLLLGEGCRHRRRLGLGLGPRQRRRRCRRGPRRRARYRRRDAWRRDGPERRRGEAQSQARGRDDVLCGCGEVLLRSCGRGGRPLRSLGSALSGEPGEQLCSCGRRGMSARRRRHGSGPGAERWRCLLGAMLRRCLSGAARRRCLPGAAWR